MMKTNKPVLSPNFTVDDIRKLRNYNSLRHKDMSTEELNKELKTNVDEFNKHVNSIRLNKGLITRK